MTDLDHDLPRTTRSRGFSPPAAVAILVGVTALSVVGSLGLGMALIPQPQVGAATARQLSYPDDVLTQPTEAAQPEATPAAPAAPTPAASTEPSAPTPAPPPRAVRPRPTTAPAPAGEATRQAARDDLGLDSGDPLGPITFDEIEG